MPVNQSKKSRLSNETVCYVVTDSLFSFVLFKNVFPSFYRYYSIAALACEQALRRAASAGREKEEELATTSLEFEYLHRKSRCEMQIGGHDIRSDVTSVFHVFLNVSLHSR